MALSSLRHIAAGEIAGAWDKFEGFGDLLTGLALFLELPILQNIVTASRYARAQSSAWSHLARERENLQLAKYELIKINRG